MLGRPLPAHAVHQTRAWLARVLVAVLAALGTPAVAVDAGIRVIDEATAVVSGDRRVPAGEAAVRVTLPDDWAVSRPGYAGSVWYHTRFRLDETTGPEDLLALYI